MFLTVFVLIMAICFTKVNCTYPLPESGNQVHLSIFMEEELPRTSPVVDLTSLLKRNTIKFEPHLGSVQDAEIKFSFLEPNSKFFIDYVHPDTQILRVQSRVDRESICPASSDICSSSFSSSGNQVTYSIQNQGPHSCALSILLIAEIEYKEVKQKTLSQIILQLKIHILDINDNAPSWRSFTSSMVSLQQVNETQTSYTSLMTTPTTKMIPKLELKIPEHTVIGTRFALPSAIDPDACPENTTAVYGIDSQTVMDAFVLDWEHTMKSGLKTTGAGLWLRVNKDLDHDDHPQHQVIIFASDAGVPKRLTGHLVLNISITDVNDHPPKFSKQRDVVWVREHELIGSRIYQPKANDLDSSDQSRLNFGFSPSTTASARALFKVNEQNGEVSVQGVIDFEQGYQHKLLLFVSDGKWTDEMELVILVLNLNDHAPDIKLYSHLSVPSKDIGFFQTSSRNYLHAQLTVVVKENGPPNQLIATVTVTDKDVSAQLRAESMMTSLSSDSGSIQRHEEFLKSSPVKKGERPKLVCSVDNDQFVMESLQLDATEQSNDHFRFKISLSGRPLDREKQNRIILQIQCYDEDRVSENSHPASFLASSQPHQSSLYVPVGRKSSSASLLVLVTDENDSPPVFVGPKLVKLAENSPADTLVLRLHATDADDPHTTAGSAGLRYQLIDEPMVVLTKNTNSPITGRKLSELTNDGEVSANKLPLLPWFHLNPLSGELKTLVSFDREVIQTIVLQFEVSDGGDQNIKKISTSEISKDPVGSHSENFNTINGTVTIEIVDVNDCFPTFSQQLYEFNLSEDVRPPVRVGRVNVSDCDVDEGNRLVEFWLQSSMSNKRNESPGNNHLLSWHKPVGGDSQTLSWFSISKSGELFVRTPHFLQTGLVPSHGLNLDDHSPLDRERNEIIVLDIYARDSGTPPLTGSAQILIRVLDVNDHAPEWEFPRPQQRLVNLSADAAVGNRVARLSALDPDEGPRGKVAYAIISGNEAGQFELDSESGWIYLSQPIDDHTWSPSIDTSLSAQSANHPKWPTRTSSMIRLYVQASDHGDPPRTSSSVLDIVIQRHLMPILNGNSNTQMRTDGVRQGKEFDIRESNPEAPSTEIHSGVYFESDRPTRGFLLSSDFLTLVAMITATLAALLLIVILFVVIRCRKLKRSQQQPNSTLHASAQLKWDSSNYDRASKQTPTDRNVQGGRSCDYFAVCLGRSKDAKQSSWSDRTSDKNSAVLSDSHFSTQMSGTLSSRQRYTVTDQQGHCMNDIQPSSLIGPCQTIPRIGGDAALNSNEYSFLVHSNCPVNDQSMFTGSLLNNNRNYHLHHKPSTFCSPSFGEMDIQLLPSALPVVKFEATSSDDDCKHSGPVKDNKTWHQQHEKSDGEKYFATVQSNKSKPESFYTTLSSEQKKSKADLHTACQSSSFV